MTNLECPTASMARTVAAQLNAAGIAARVRVVNGYRHEVRARTTSSKAMAALQIWVRRQVTPTGR